MDTEKKQYRIAEVRKITELSSSTIRFWVKEFSQLKPEKNEKGTLYYRHEDLQTMIQIKHLLKDQGMTIEGAKQYLKASKNGSDNFEVIEKLKGVRSFLEELRDSLQ